MITLEKATQKSIIRPHLSVHHTSFLWALLQEFVRSTIHRKPVLSAAGLPYFWGISPNSRRTARFSRVAAES